MTMHKAALMVAGPALLLAACDPAGNGDVTVNETAASSHSQSEERAGVDAEARALNAAIQSGSEELLWLEEVEGEEALAFARAQNERSLGHLQADPRYQQHYDRALEVLESTDRIPFVTVRGGELWNFWQDAQNTHGLWRRTTLESYETANPEWDVVLDLDALADEEGRNWVWRGSSCLAPDYRHCMLTLSDGGSDAAHIREWDMESRSFVEDGFVVPPTKGTTAWIDEDTLLIATALDPAETTTSGYPFVVKRWTRGTPIEEAQVVFTGAASDVGVWPARFQQADGTFYLLATQAETFFESVYWLLPDNAQGEPIRLTLPRRVSPQALFGDQLVFSIEEDWTPVEGGETYPQGAVLSLSMSQLAATGELPAIETVFVPGERQSVGGFAATANHLLAVIDENVVGGLWVFARDENGWQRRQVETPENTSVSITTADDQSDLAFVSAQGYLTPNTLYRVSADATSLSPAKSMPAWFDTTGLEVEQREAVSRDGTRIPYFIIHNPERSGAQPGPTLLYAYGGFQVSLNPSYSGTMGRLWLENGGTYVLANIRGGGEFGPAWHQAGLTTNRQRIYDDLIAVSEALIADGITTPGQLGVVGGSNGGLLTGVMYTQRPDLFGAVISQVPLLDMMRFHTMLAGASWQAEYGFPDENPDERAFLRSISPLHNVDPDREYPPLFLLTSTKDDRVHPAHARKLAYLTDALGLDMLYYENMEGGHSAAANLRETANRLALEYTFLMQNLMDGEE
ncbi:prolyl oligopeptidase family serine peptidase [Glycocaulis sp.]|uniref:prolyl oligopeptidase family serine peptidase n=1 Tax=Glycocaulis sp. TaxID=1969725 RepID=UPI003D194469